MPKAQRFWSRVRCNALSRRLWLATVPVVDRGRFTLAELESLVRNAHSAYRPGRLEGIVIRHEEPRWCLRRAKLVHPDFVQNIHEHWLARAIEWNTLEVSPSQWQN